MLITDPAFYAVAVPAALLMGLAKSGLAAGTGALAVPLMALAVPVPQAAAIMLPLLMAADVVGLSQLLKHCDWRLVRLLLPAGLAGTVLGWALFGWLSGPAVAGIVGALTLVFVAIRLLARPAGPQGVGAGGQAGAVGVVPGTPGTPGVPGLPGVAAVSYAAPAAGAPAHAASSANPPTRHARDPSAGPPLPGGEHGAPTGPRPLPRPAVGRLMAALSGFTSFVAHAGSPPIGFYVLPLKLPPLVFSATMAVFFATLNLSKWLPYAMLGLIDATNMLTSTLLMPLPMIGVWVGVRLLERVSQALFNRLFLFGMTLTGFKLMWDGLRSTWGGG